ncbi:MAG TPA: aminoacyl-tRNA hydrolase [Anaerolineaceae bacterium]|nr:aminoacyl-tRNA hydrolase [Anaerolineaceae bacterium]
MEDINKDLPVMIVGLGNPGLAYRRTRHNFGFLAIDKLANELNIPVKRLKFKAMIGEGRFGDNKVVLVKPLTFMNESGRAVAPLLRFFKLPLTNLLVIHDDLDLPLGTLRLRPSGGTSGQRGMASIITQLGTQEFPRMRLGIGRPPGQMDPVDYVLKDFHPSENELKKIVLQTAVEASQTFINEGLTTTMNKFNGEVS